MPDRPCHQAHNTRQVCPCTRVLANVTHATHEPQHQHSSSSRLCSHAVPDQVLACNLPQGKA